MGPNILIFCVDSVLNPLRLRTGKRTSINSCTSLRSIYWSLNSAGETIILPTCPHIVRKYYEGLLFVEVLCKHDLVPNRLDGIGWNCSYLFCGFFIFGWFDHEYALNVVVPGNYLLFAHKCHKGCVLLIRTYPRKNSPKFH